MTTLMNEWTTLGAASNDKVDDQPVQRPRNGALEEAIRIWNERPEAKTPVARQRLAQAWIESEVLRLTNERAAGLRLIGDPGPEGSIAKLMFAEVNKRIYELCVDLLGADAMVGYDYSGLDRPGGLMGPPGTARQFFLRSRANSIEGGTSEVQRNILGERVLGLPAEPRTDNSLPWHQVPRN